MRRAALHLLGDHGDRAAGALFGAQAAALAVVVLELVLAGLDLRDRIIRADAETVVAAETVAARHAAAGLEDRGLAAAENTRAIAGGNTAVICDKSVKGTGFIIDLSL